MRTRLPETLTGEAREVVETALRACVHCGMCNATCPTYLLTGEELMGPRGRIYLMKQALEGEPVTDLTREALDACLGCRAWGQAHGFAGLVQQLLPPQQGLPLGQLGHQGWQGGHPLAMDPLACEAEHRLGIAAIHGPGQPVADRFAAGQG